MRVSVWSCRAAHVRLATWLLVFSGCWGVAEPLRGQAPETPLANPAAPSLARPGTMRAAVESLARTRVATSDPLDRQAQFAELDRDVQAFERFGRVLRTVVQLGNPSVVHIEASSGGGTANGRREPTVEEAGSGVIVELAGRPYVLTNRHVVLDAAPEQIQMRLHDSRSLTAEWVKADPSTDVAVVAVKERELTPARLGDSQLVDIGDFVLALGSPFGLSHSVTFGIISAKGRRDLQLGNDDVRLQDFLQTDAAINPGNSGGPLLNLRGEVIGINTAIASSSGGSEGIGFAIPINMVVYVARQLVERGEVTHAYLGVRLENGFGPELARELGVTSSRGALVKAITPGSPADRARLQVHDLITHFNETDVESDVHLVNLVGLTPVGERVALRVIRAGQPVEVEVEVGERKKFESD
ncbi:MAG: trypsin-like peptidase domain-containing protein [Pirellulales bacterium]